VWGGFGKRECWRELGKGRHWWSKAVRPWQEEIGLKNSKWESWWGLVDCKRSRSVEWQEERILGKWSFLWEISLRIAVLEYLWRHVIWTHSFDPTNHEIS
jgi:hypothetical protein